MRGTLSHYPLAWRRCRILKARAFPESSFVRDGVISQPRDRPRAQAARRFGARTPALSRSFVIAARPRKWVAFAPAALVRTLHTEPWLIARQTWKTPFGRATCARRPGSAVPGAFLRSKRSASNPRPRERRRGHDSRRTWPRTRTANAAPGGSARSPARPRRRRTSRASPPGHHSARADAATVAARLRTAARDRTRQPTEVVMRATDVQESSWTAEYVRCARLGPKLRWRSRRQESSWQHRPARGARSLGTVETLALVRRHALVDELSMRRTSCNRNSAVR